MRHRSRSGGVLVAVLSILALAAAARHATAQTTGTITGTVTDELTGAPLATTTSGSSSFTIIVCPSSATTCETYSSDAAYTYTDAAGRYTIQNLAAGTYYLKATGSSPYINEVYPDIPCVAQDCRIRQGTPIAVTAVGTSTVNFALGQGGQIGGTVRRADTGAGVYGWVSAYNAQTSYVKHVDTNSSGAYTISGLPAGSYYVLASGTESAGQTYLEVLYPNIPCGIAHTTCPLPMGSLVAVTTGATTTVDFSLPAGGSISGTVTAADTGAPLPSGVGVYAVGPASRYGAVDAAGHYTVTGLPAGRYYLKATATFATDPKYLTTYYGGACDGCGSTGQQKSIEVQNGATTAGIDVALVARGTFGGSIAGTLASVTNALPHMSAWCARVAAYDTGGHFVRATDFSQTGFQWGAYVIDALPAGTYYVRFENPACSSKYGVIGGRTPDVTYGTSPCITVDCDLRRGTPVVVSAGRTTGGIDFVVPDGGSIAVDIGSSSQYSMWFTDTELYDARGVRIRSGRFIIRIGTMGWPVGPAEYVGLPDGTYYARTPDGRLHANLTCADCPATAGRPIVIRSHSSESTQFPAVTQHRVSGTVRDADTHAPLSTITVEAYTLAGTLVASDVTDATGRYVFSAAYASIGPGTYFLRTRNTRGYADRLYASAPCAGCDPFTGTAVTVAAADVSGVDFSLPPGGFVQAATNDSSGVPLAGQTIAFFDATGEKVAREPVGTNGAVTLQLQPGTYYARTEPVSGYAMTTYGVGACARGACDPTSGTPVNITLTSPVSLSLPVSACTPGDFTPSILASATMGHAFRQVFTPSTPDTRVYVSAGRLPTGLALDVSTGVLSGTPSESGVFGFSVASVDAAGCAFVREYTLQVAQCVFALSSDSVTVASSGGAVTVTASDVCGYSTVSSQASWISADATAASASSPLTLTIAANSETAARVGTITIGFHVFTVSQAGLTSSAPYGVVDAPADRATVSGSMAMTGWALDDLEVRRVAIYRDAVAGETAGVQVYVGEATFVPGARPDVEAAYPGVPNNNRGGWGFLLLTNTLPSGGNGSFRLYAFAEDTEGRSTLLGFRTITAANSAATVPFGAIDTPAQGATVSGSNYINWGWALTPSPKLIAIDGSTIAVYVDGVRVGTLNAYNLYRPDVSGLFPGLQNSGGPVGYRAIDTTALSEGLHTISWVATDDAGQAAGIGSRYFTVQNSAWTASSSLVRLKPDATTDRIAAPSIVASGFGRTDNSVVVSGFSRTDNDTPVPPRLAGVDIERRAASLRTLPLDEHGARLVEIQPLQRIEFDLRPAEAACAATYEGYEVVRGELRDLPVGASLDRDGIFYWQPGPGFLGSYRLLFVRTPCDGSRERVPFTVVIREGV